MEVKLEAHEFVCPKCNGTGLLFNNEFIPEVPEFIMYECVYCDGLGIIDWITNILGKTERLYINKVRMTKASFKHRKNLVFIKDAQWNSILSFK